MKLSAKASFQRQLQRYSALSQRTRASILAVCGLLIYLLYNGLWADDNRNSHRQLASEQQRLTLVIEQLQNRKRQLQQQLERPDNGHQIETVQRLQQQLEKLNRELSNQLNHLVPAEQLATILQQVLHNVKPLQLMALHTQAIEPIQIQSQTSESETDGDSTPAVLYKHSVSLSLRGEYFQVVDYLTALEALPWKFYWQRLDYQVQAYPKAQADLTVYTLSSERGALGV